MGEQHTFTPNHISHYTDHIRTQSTVYRLHMRAPNHTSHYTDFISNYRTHFIVYPKSKGTIYRLT